MNLLECLHDRPCVPSPHRLPHTCLSQYASKIISFQTKSFLFLKTHYRVSVKYWTTLRGECVGEPFVTIHGPLRRELLDNLPTQFIEKSSVEILFTNISFLFHFCFISCHALTLKILGYPSAYGMHDANSNTFMLIYSHAYILT